MCIYIYISRLNWSTSSRESVLLSKQSSTSRNARNNISAFFWMIWLRFDYDLIDYCLVTCSRRFVSTNDCASSNTRCYEIIIWLKVNLRIIFLFFYRRLLCVAIDGHRIALLLLLLLLLTLYIFRWKLIINELDVYSFTSSMQSDCQNSLKIF